MIKQLPNGTLWALLLLPLVISPLLGLLTPYVALLVIIPLFVVTLVRRDALAAYSSYDARALLGIFVLFAIICAVTADSVSDTLRAFNFTMFLAYGAIALFLERRSNHGAAERVAQLAAVGVVIGTAEIAFTLAAEHFPRPAGLNIGPIVLSNALLALGFLAAGGVLIRRDRLSWLYLLVPAIAIVATGLTGSRGPLIGVPFATVAAAIFVWHVRLGRSVRAGIAGVIGLVAVLAIGVLGILQGRANSLLGIVGSGGAVVDESTRQRLVLYRAGWQSFLQSPLIGHGWGNIIPSIRPFMGWKDLWLSAYLPQLHNDVLNFAVASGLVGVAAYFVVISVPIVGALLSPRDTLRTFRLYGATVITIVYMGGGLTDLMFGFEFHTFLFATLTAIILHYCRDERAA